MRRVELLIETARKLSQNTRYDQTSGIGQDIFVQFLNNAQDSLVMEIQNLKTKYFRKTEIVPAVPGQEAYAWPSDCYMQHVDTIQWTDNANGTYWHNLYKTQTKEKITLQPGYPFAYIPYEDGFHLNPPIQSGQLYVTYMRTPRKLAKRSGQISVATVSSGILTALEVNSSGDPFDLADINSQNYLCVFDKFGNVKVSNIAYDSCNNLGVFTLSPFNLGTQTIAVGDYIGIGQNVTNIPELSNICEGYLLKHMVYEAKYGDSSSFTPQALKDLEMYFFKLSGSFATLSDDISSIVITNLDYIGW